MNHRRRKRGLGGRVRWDDATAQPCVPDWITPAGSVVVCAGVFSPAAESTDSGGPLSGHHDSDWRIRSGAVCRFTTPVTHAACRSVRPSITSEYTRAGVAVLNL